MISLVIVLPPPAMLRVGVVFSARHHFEQFMLIQEESCLFRIVDTATAAGTDLCPLVYYQVNLLHRARFAG